MGKLLGSCGSTLNPSSVVSSQPLPCTRVVSLGQTKLGTGVCQCADAIVREGSGFGVGHWKGHAHGLVEARAHTGRHGTHACTLSWVDYQCSRYALGMLAKSPAVPTLDNKVLRSQNTNPLPDL